MDIEALIPSACARPAQRRVSIADVCFGGSIVPVIAGPCAVEPGYLGHALAAADAGASVLRGCIHKPRTRPASFQGMGASGFELLREARERTGRPVLAEPLSVEHLTEIVAHVDALLIGARSMQNTPLLRAAGQSGHPVILKRAPSATYEEWLGAAEYITAEGNANVILCERGIRTFEPTTRNTLDISAVPVLRGLTELPIVVDPSHAAGNAGWVASLALAAVAAGADGLLIESHPSPAESWSDAHQAVTPAVLRSIIDAVNLLAATTRSQPAGDLDQCRKSIDGIDAAIARLAERRTELARLAEGHRNADALASRDHQREQAVVARMATLAPSLGVEGAERLVAALMDAGAEPECAA